MGKDKRLMHDTSMVNTGAEPRVIAIVPAFNEEGNIVSTIEDLKKILV